MAKFVQHLRKSQFILIYGPGSIIESRNGPRLIPSVCYGLKNKYFNSEVFHEFEISDSRLRVAINKVYDKKKQRVRIFSLPTNAALKIPEKYPLYSTYQFPVWKICYGQSKKHEPILYNSYNCPLCGIIDDSSQVRFVCACTDGHLDEVFWDYAVHSKEAIKSKCNPAYFKWIAGGSSLSDLVIECPKCGLNTNMQEIYKLNFSCSGRFPDKEVPPLNQQSPYITNPNRPKNCRKRMKVIQRQSSSLRTAETLTLLTIPEYDSPISRILQINQIAVFLSGLINLIKNGTIKKDIFLEQLKTSSFIDEESKSIFEEYLKNNGILELCNLYNELHNEEKDIEDFIFEEFNSLLSGPRVSDNFSLSESKKFKFNNIPFEIYPINKIKTVTVQLGYIRRPYPNHSVDEEQEENIFDSLISTCEYLDDNYWYLGYEGTGEGLLLIFKDLKNNFFSPKNFGDWLNKDAYKNKFSSPLWLNIIENPFFVWLHTLSHLIIKSLSLYSGYSSTSLRERIYLDKDSDTGGILIYTTSAGEDGGMGGLVSIVNDFEIIIKRSIENIKICSNDPLCSEVKKNPDRVNGAACYSCLLVSETSCEHRNRWLDRHLILDNL